MAIETPIAGAYTTTWNAVAIGFTEDGFNLSMEAKAELVNNTDLYGDTIIDLIYRGGNCYLDTVAKIYKAGSTGPWWPYGALGTIATSAAPIGRLGSAIAQALVLTAVAATPAAATPATLTASKAILPPDNQLSLTFTSKLRKVPLRWLALPSESTGTITVFATT